MKKAVYSNHTRGTSPRPIEWRFLPTTTLQIAILASTTLALAVEPFRFESLTFNAPTQQEAEKGDPAENAKG